MNKPNKTELEYFIRYSLDSGKYKRYMELYEEIERLHSIIKEIRDYIEESDILELGIDIPYFRIDDMRFFENIYKILDKVGSDKE